MLAIVTGPLICWVLSFEAVSEKHSFHKSRTAATTLSHTRGATVTLKMTACHRRPLQDHTPRTVFGNRQEKDGWTTDMGDDGRTSRRT